MHHFLLASKVSTMKPRYTHSAGKIHMSDSKGSLAVQARCLPVQCYNVCAKRRNKSQSMLLDSVLLCSSPLSSTNSIFYGPACAASSPLTSTICSPRTSTISLVSLWPHQQTHPCLQGHLRPPQLDAPVKDSTRIHGKAVPCAAPGRV